jgi:hypothetical protein
MRIGAKKENSFFINHVIIVMHGFDVISHLLHLQINFSKIILSTQTKLGDKIQGPDTMACNQIIKGKYTYSRLLKPSTPFT